ncbi:MAG: hypothetical protein LBI15_12110 [Dysgonamonadaceae bacterium]|jgi:hypothetical protein|nr:hypothetical protein [Dysgonamonadaceae bacterium]
MKKYLFTAICSLFILWACSDEYSSTYLSKEEESSRDIILQARKVVGERPTSKPELRSERPVPTDHPFRYLGYTYKFGSLIGHSDNLGRQIVDVEAMYNDPIMRQYTEIFPLLSTDAKVNSYSSYERFETSNEMNKKIETDFSISYGLFSAKRKQTVTDLFKNSGINIFQELTGEVDLTYIHSRVWLDNVSGAQKMIAANYLRPTFTQNLYLTPIAEMMDKWGTVVVSNYYTGGRANALYVADYTGNTTSETRERDMTTHLNASFSWKGIGASANFGSSYKGTSNYSTESNIRRVNNRIQLSGGLPHLALTTKVDNIEDNNIDLTAWLQSLSDVKNHVVIDVADRGLVGLDKFVLEENFRRRIRDTHLGHLTQSYHEIPYIEISKVHIRTLSTGEQLYDVLPVLTTRHGDKIILGDGNSANLSDAELRHNNDNAVFMSKAQAIATQKGKYYEWIEIRTNPSRIIRPFIRVPLAIEFKFDESSVFKYKNPQTNMMYIYDQRSRTAFAYYDDEFIPWDYGMLDWVEKIPIRNIPMSSLYQLFTIVGL